MWDLHRNRGSVQATTERILMGGSLEPVSACLSSIVFLADHEQAPPSFQPPIALTSTSSTSTSTPRKPVQIAPDLITRYNLQSRINSKGKEKEIDSPASGWASTKDARQQVLQRRRDEMILAARRKMQEKDAGTGSPSP